MNAAVASVLNKVLGDWLEGLNSDQLNLSIFSGKISLGPIRVRKEAIEKLGLPFQMKYGYVKRIYVQIPWTNLTSKPLIIEIEDVFILAAPKPMAEWSEEIELQNQKLLKTSNLEQLELLHSEQFAASSAPGFVEKMVTKIIDNLQVKISGVYIRLEDSVASIQPYALGLVLGKVEAVTCNSSWTPQYVENSPSTYKRAVIQDLSLFLDYGDAAMLTCQVPGQSEVDSFESLARKEVKQLFPGRHHYLLSPAGVELKVVLNKSNERFTQPEIEATLIVGDAHPIELVVETPQLTHVLKLAEFYSTFSVYQTGIQSKVNTLLWTEEEAQSYREHYKEWVKFKTDKWKAEQLNKRIQDLEEGHTYSEIARHRNMAHKEQQIDHQETAIKEEIVKYKAKPAGVMAGVKGFFGWGKSSVDDEEERLLQLSRAESELSDIQSARKSLQVDFSKREVEYSSMMTEPNDYLKIKILAEMPRFSCAVKSDTSPLLTLVQEELLIDLGVRTTTIIATVDIARLVILDEVAHSQVFPHIIKTGAFHLVYNQNPDGVTDVVFRAEHLLFVLNLPCFLSLSKAFLTAIADQFDISHYRRVAGDKVAGYVNAGQKYMEQIVLGNYAHQAMNLDIEFSAPLAVIPLNINEAKNCLVADLGTVVVKSQLAPSQSSQYDYSKIVDEGLLYDFYKVTVANMQVSVLSSFDTIEKWRNGKSTPIFEPSPLTVEVGNAVARDQSNFPGLLGRVRLEEIAFSLSDDQLLFLLRLKDQCLEQMEATLPKHAAEARENSIRSEELDVVETQGFKDKMKEIPKVLSQHFEFDLKQVTANLLKRKQPLLTLIIADVKAMASITDQGNMMADFQVGEMQVNDCREGVFFKKVLCKPHRNVTVSVDVGSDRQFQYHDKRIAMGSAMETEAQICMRVKMYPRDDLIEGLLNLSNLRLTCASDFISDLMQYPKEAFETAQEEADMRKLAIDTKPIKFLSRVMTMKLKQIAEKHRRPEAKFYSAHKNILMTVIIQDLEAWVPQSSKDELCKVVDVYLESTLRYNSSQDYTHHMDIYNKVIRTDVTRIDDEATIDVDKFGVICGCFKDNRITQIMRDKDELVAPCRLEVEYLVTKKEGPLHTQIDAHLESMDAVVGFRDLIYLKSLAAQWGALAPVPEEPKLTKTVSLDNSPVLSQEEDFLDYKLDLKCDSLQVTMVDDTGSRMTSLVSLELNNLSSSVFYSDQVLNANFASGLTVNYYNSTVACWEPIIESWSLELDMKQPDAATPIEARVQSGALLNVNLSYSMAETVSLVLLKLGQNTEEWELEHDGATVTESDENVMSGGQVIYKLKNRLGTTVNAWIEGGDPQSRDIWNINPGKSHSFGQVQVEKVRMNSAVSGKRKYASLLHSAQPPSSIAIEIEHLGKVLNIIVDSIGTKSFIVEMEPGSHPVTAVVDISSKGEERIVSLESCVKFVNNTELNVEVMHRGRKVEVLSTRAFALPLNWIMSDSPTVLVTGDGHIDLLNTTGLFQYDTRSFLTLDYVMLQSGTTELDAVIKIPNQKIIILNPPMVIQNLTPSVLSLYLQTEPEALCKMSPGAVSPIYGSDPRKPLSHKWVMQLTNDVKLETDWVLPKKNPEHYHLTGTLPADKLTEVYIPMSFLKSKDLDLKLKTIVEEKWYGSVVQIYCQFWIVNSTPYHLEFTGKRDFLKIPKNSVGTVKDKKAQMKVRIAEEEFGNASEWSKPFNIRTVGIAGSLQLNNSTAALNRPVPNVIQLGVKLENASWPLVKSVIVHVQPRFIICNYLSFPVFIRQCKKERVIELPTNESIPYQLENAKVGQGVQISEDMVNWSSGFNLEEIEDIQIRFKGREDETKPAAPSFLAKPSLLGMLSKASKHNLDWWKPNKSNDFFHYVRVIIATDDEATIFINLANPADPEFLIANKTEQILYANQEGCEILTSVQPSSRANFVYDDQLTAVKKVKITIGNHSETYVIDKLKEYKKKVAGNKVKVITEGVTRVVVIEPDVEEEAKIEGNSQSEKLKKAFKFIGAKYRFENIKAKIDFSGLVISLIDDMPSERFVFSTTGIRIKATQIIQPKIRSKFVTQTLKVRVQNIQMDHMQAKGSEFPIMFGSFVSGQTDPNEEPVPFFQMRLEKDSTLTVEDKAKSEGPEFSVIEHFKHVALLMQPMQLQVHQDTIMGLLGVATRIQEAFFKISDMKRSFSVSTIDFMKVCPALEASPPKLSFNASQASTKAYFEFVNINSMKIVVSFRSASTKSHLQIDPREAFGIVSIFGRIGAGFITISDSPLHFSNVILLHSFQTINAMTWTIAENYIRQGVLQFYKIIGSSDMIGNPIGLIDKLGTGVFEFFNEPRKGLLKGPKGFAEGIGKGVKSLVSGVVSGGFGSVSRITGSLYTVVRGVGGDENSYDRINRNDNVAGGLYHGLKGGLQDLAEGVTGLFTKPFKGAKAGGVKGFFKGVGSGLLGVVTAPLSAVLRVSTSVTSGIANTATLLRTGKIHQKGRFRFPRPVGARKVIEPYNEEVAQAQELLQTLKEFANDKLVFYLRIDTQVIVMITTMHMLEIINGDIRSKVLLRNIEVCQVHSVRHGFLLYAGGANGGLAVKAKQFTSLAKLYAVLSVNSGKIDPNKPVPRGVKVATTRRRCC